MGWGHGEEGAYKETLSGLTADFSAEALQARRGGMTLKVLKDKNHIAKLSVKVILQKYEEEIKAFPANKN